LWGGSLFARLFPGPTTGDGEASGALPTPPARLLPIEAWLAKGVGWARRMSLIDLTRRIAAPALRPWSQTRVRHNSYHHLRLDVAEPDLELNPVVSKIAEDGNTIEITFNGPGMVFATHNHCLGSVPAIQLLPGQTTGQKPARTFLGELWKRNGERLLCGGGDVILNVLQPHSDHAHRNEPQTLELTAGLHRRMGEIDLRSMLHGDMDFWLSPTAFIALEPGIEVTSAMRKDPTKAALARGPIVYRFKLAGAQPSGAQRPARIWFDGMNGYKIKKFRPGKAYHYYQGYVIGATSNIDCLCESPLVYHPTRRQLLEVFKKRKTPANLKALAKGATTGFGKVLRWCMTGQVGTIRHWLGIQFDSISSGEGFVRYTLRNNSQDMGYVLVQANRTLVPEMPGLTGFFFRPLAWVLHHLPRLH
jgi:hypothetical protein